MYSVIHVSPDEKANQIKNTQIDKLPQLILKSVDLTYAM